MRPQLLKTLVALVIGVIASLIGGVILVKTDPHLKAYFFPPARRISYFLTVQKIRDGKPYQEPFQTSGQEVFESGYRFKFKLLSPESGYFYLFNEGTTDDARVYFNILYPTPKRNNGSAEIGPSELAESGENEFGGTANTEKLWIIWTKEKIPDLETAKASAFSSSGKILDPAQEKKLRAFLQEHTRNKLATEKEVGSKETVIKGTGDVVVSLLHLEHR
jgi:hypothetical protein